jgi:hypothetical protein
MPDLIALVRFAVVALIVLAGGGVFTVMRLHYRAWRKLRHEDRAGLTPLHVMLVSLGVLLWGVALAWAVTDQLVTGSGTVPVDVIVRTVLYGAGAIAIIAALIVVGGIQRRRVSFTRDQRTVTVHDGESVDVQTDTSPS